MRICRFDGCEREVSARGYCRAHYEQHRLGHGTRPLGRRSVAPIVDRLDLYTDKTADCWVWTSTINRLGYGVMSVESRKKYVHRLSYERHRGPIPQGMVIDHLCRNRACLNPDHLEVVTQAENVRRGLRGVLAPEGNGNDE